MTEPTPGGDGVPIPVGVIDAHTHAFPAEVIARRAATAAAEPWFAALYGNGRAVLASADDVLRSMDGAGVARSVVCGFPWRDLGRCRAHNDDLAAAAMASGGRLAWLATVPPAAGPAAAAEADRAFALGAAGVGELNGDAQGFDLCRRGDLADLAECCVAAGRPVLVHASESVGHGYPGKGTATPEKLLAFVAAFPALRVVFAHWGGGLPFYELMPEVRLACVNVAYDTGASTYLYRPAVFRTVVDLVGADRVLWGSDYPVLRQDRFLRRTLAAGLTEPELEAVLGGSARRVYGLPPLSTEVAQVGDHGPGAVGRP